MKDTDDPAYVQSLARGLAVIRAFGPETPVLTLADVARATGLTRATARRFLLTLEHLGYVQSSQRDFRLTPRVLELGFSYLSALSLPEVAQPHLEELSRVVNESTSAALLDGGSIVYVARVPTRRIMSVSITIGTRFPAAATSLGRVLLAALPDDEVDNRLSQLSLEPLTEHTLTDPTSLKEELMRVRKQGWSLVDQELEMGIRSLAAPLKKNGEVVAAINVSTVAGSSSRKDTVQRFLEPLLSVAEKISGELEHLPR
jgi:IclR family pca regulon transcriptional regulator